jgi:hypothetical protein
MFDSTARLTIIPLHIITVLFFNYSVAATVPSGNEDP